MGLVLIPTRPPQSLEKPGLLIMNLVSSLRIWMIKHISWLQTPLFTVKRERWKSIFTHTHMAYTYCYDMKHTIGLQIWKDVKVSKWWQNIFVWTIPLKIKCVMSALLVETWSLNIRCLNTQKNVLKAPQSPWIAYLILSPHIKLRK